MVHRVVRFHQDHLVFRRQLQNIGRRFLSPDEQDAGNIRHLCRPDRLHVAQTRDEEHAVAIQCQDIMVFPAVTTHDCRAGKCHYLPYLHYYIKVIFAGTM